MLSLSIALGVCHRHIAEPGADVLVVFDEGVARELHVVIRDDAIWDSEVGHYVLYQFDGGKFVDFCDRPLGELVDGNIEEVVSFGCRAYNVQTPYCERPRQEDGL